ncbi:MAG: maltokinase [Pseudonocardiales bacterium]|nr:maltokinase [Pseudonocardiales bacterium]
MIDRSALQPLVEGWLPAQRWFAGKGRSASIEVAPLAVLDDGPPPVELWTAEVSYDDGSHETYQLPLVVHAERADSLDHVLLGTIDGAAGPMWLYDALHDKDVTAVWLRGMRDERTDGALQFRRYVDADEIPVDEPSLVLTGEQSNTSMMFGDLAIVKVFRRLQPGVNPDIEIHAALGRQGARHVARLFGTLEDETGGELRALAMAQEYLTTATDGWELAKASVRDLLAERDLHADEAGGDFAGESARLGAAIADIHTDLAEAFGLSNADQSAVAARADAMRTRLDQAIEIVPDLAPLADGMRALYADFEKQTDALALQRIHGDLHLGQALRTAQRWVVIDFEGEPMADLASRRLPDTPLRDIAGMLRSFEYAGYHRLIETGVDAQLTYRAAEWTERNREAFSVGYADAAGTDPHEHATVLRAFEADKAVYEAIYEARNRPTWLPIPLASLARLVESEGAA